MYKKEIGAHIETRQGFLERWIPAVHSQPKAFLALSSTPANQVILKGFVPEAKKPEPMAVEVDFNTLSVKELKALLSGKNIDFSDCIEKADLVKRLIEKQ